MFSSSDTDSGATDSLDLTQGAPKRYFINGVKNFFEKTKNFLGKTKYFLAVVKAVSAASQSFFATQVTSGWVSKNNDILSPINFASGAVSALTSGSFIAGTRSRQMLKDSSDPAMLLAYSELSAADKMKYWGIVSMMKGSLVFSAFASYNGAFNLLKTIVALAIQSSSEEEILDFINEKPALQFLIQTISFTFLTAQMLSFEKFQCKSVEKYLLTWWLKPEERNEQIASLGKWNALMATNFIITTSSATFFSVFATESGLNNFNNSFLKPLNTSLSETTLDALVSTSAFCAAVFSIMTTVPSNYIFLNKKKNNTPNKPFTMLGKSFLVTGVIDMSLVTCATIYSSVNRLSKLFNTDFYNYPLIVMTSCTIGPTNLLCNYSYNITPVLQEFYSVNAEPLEEKLINREKDFPSNLSLNPRLLVSTSFTLFSPRSPDSLPNIITIDMEATRTDDHKQVYRPPSP